MNYTKAQQDILAEIMKENTHPGVCAYHDEERKVELFTDSSAVMLYAIPDKLVAINVKRCRPLDRLPFNPCQIAAEKEATHRGELVQLGKQTLLKFDTCYGTPMYLDKKLRDKFSKDAHFYQEAQHKVVTVAEGTPEDPVLIGYICPVRYTQKTQNQ